MICVQVSLLLRDYTFDKSDNVMVEIPNISQLEISACYIVNNHAISLTSHKFISIQVMNYIFIENQRIRIDMSSKDCI